MRRFLLLIVVLLTMLALTAPVAAITNGHPDGDNHPYVGILVFDVAPGQPAWRCSGASIAPNVVLTAGHCTEDAVAARVWFDERLQDDDGTYLVPDCPGGGLVAVEGTPYTHPLFRSEENPYGGGNGLPAFSYRDVGIVVLDDPVDVGGFAALPTPGLVDTPKNKTGIDFVGYGAQEQLQIPGSYLPQPPPYYR